MRSPHARPATLSPRDRARFWILTRWPLRFWWRLSPATRDWWVREYQRRHPFGSDRFPNI